jgi:hypothetical protein
MKKILIITGLFLISFGTMVQAQNYGPDLRENMRFGIKAGVNLANVWDAQGEDFRADPKLGFAGGIFLELPVGKFIGFQPALLYSQKGFRGDGTLLGSAYSLTRTSSYLDVPLMLQIKPSPAFTLAVGPQYSYLINEKNVYSYGANSIEQEQAFSNDNIRKNVLGLLTGVDVNFSNFVISGRVGWDFQTNHGDGSSSTPRYKNRWLQLTAGLKI